MFYNLTDNQKELARFLVKHVRSKELAEIFYVVGDHDGRVQLSGFKDPQGKPSLVEIDVTLGAFDALAEAKLVIQRISYETSVSGFGTVSTSETHRQFERNRECTLLGLIYTAVDNNFVADTPSPLVGPETPPRTSHVPNTAFIMMWMEKTHAELDDVSNAIKDVCDTFSIKAVRADDIEHQDRITDVVLQHIRESEFLIADMTGERPNVYYEVGYAHALGKRPILYRKEGTPLHFDLSVHNVPEYRNVTNLKELSRRRLEGILGRAPMDKSS
ncbi:MAG: hypothetical protein ABR611_09360 [Chthoniobacterales bacterium]